MSAGTLEVFARELAEALRPLEQRLAAGSAEDFFAELGLRLPPGFTAQAQAASSIAAVAASAAGLAPLIVQLTDAIAADQPAQILSSGKALLGKIVDVISGMAQMRTAFNTLAGGFGGLTPAQRAALQAFAQKLPRRLLDYTLVEYLRSKGDSLVPTLSLVGLLDDALEPGIPGDPLNPPYIRRAFDPQRFVNLFLKPDQYLSDVFEWGKPGFDGHLLFTRLQDVLEEFDLPVALLTPPGMPPILEAYQLRLSTDPGVNPPALTFRLRFPATQDFERTYPLSDTLAMVLSAKARFDSGLDGSVRTPLQVSLKPPTGTANAEIRLGFRLERGGQPVVLLGEAGGSRLEVLRLAMDLGYKASFDSASGSAQGEPSGSIEVVGGKLVIDLSSGDGFISAITGGLKLDSNVDFKALWSASAGLSLEGSAAVEIAIPTHISLGPIEIQTLYIILSLAADGSLPIELSGAFSANLGPLKASVDRIGLTATLTFPEDNGNLGAANLAFKFKPPNGVGLLLDAAIIKGGGYLFIDPERGEYAGALELTFAGFLSLKAVGIITTRMPDGSPGFSLLIIITAEFGTGIQLGFGFTLLGVGGLLGLNRTMNLQPLMEGIRTGAINSILFPQNPVENAPRIISDLRTIFPPEQGIFLIGPMLKLGWGTPTLISLSVGVILEIPGNIAILGVLKVVLPDEAAALIIIQVNFAGAIEFDKQRLYFFAALFESRVLFITFEGEMGLLVAWGGDANFVVSVGGFHPRFNPPPLPFPSPRRVAFDLANTPVYRIRVEGYFAVTSNTVQFGARAELFFGLDIANVKGHISFDALFQFSPFAFIIEISASFSVSAFGVGLFSVRVSMALSGPTPWRARGSGSISLFFFDIEVDFDFTWGDHRDTTLPPTAVMGRLQAELNKVENWSAALPPGANLLVTLRKVDATAELALHPVGVLRISQRMVPLNLTIDKVGAQKPSDARKFTLTVNQNGFGKRGDAVERFPMAQFKDMDDSTKLTIPAFQDQPSGVELSAAGRQLHSSRMVKRVVRYELITIDTNNRSFTKRFFNFASSLFVHFLAGNSAARSALSQATRRQMDARLEKVAYKPEGYAVAFNMDNTVFTSGAVPAAAAAGEVSFTSYSQAQEYMQQAIAADPNLELSLHVIPASELNVAAE